MPLLPDWKTLTLWQKVKWIAAGVGALVTSLVILGLVIANWSARREYLKLLGEKKDLLLGMFSYFRKKDVEQAGIEEKTRMDLKALDDKIRKNPEAKPVQDPPVVADPDLEEMKRKAKQAEDRFKQAGGRP